MGTFGLVSTHLTCEEQGPRLLIGQLKIRCFCLELVMFMASQMTHRILGKRPPSNGRKRHSRQRKGQRGQRREQGWQKMNLRRRRSSTKLPNEGSGLCLNTMLTYKWKTHVWRSCDFSATNLSTSCLVSAFHCRTGGLRADLPSVMLGPFMGLWSYFRLSGGSTWYCTTMLAASTYSHSSWSCFGRAARKDTASQFRKSRSTSFCTLSPPIHKKPFGMSSWSSMMTDSHKEQGRIQKEIYTYI